jgi:hypothetical protein
MSDDTTTFPASATAHTPEPGEMPPTPPREHRSPRTSTIVWGFIVLAVGIVTISVAAGAALDLGLVLIWLLAAAGAVLVVASLAGAARRRSTAAGR